MTASIHDLFPIGPRSVDQEPGFVPLSPAPASCPPIDLRAALVDRRSTLDKITDAIGSPRFLSFYCGVYVGCLLTVALAFAWSFAR
jgi:hypothetical protein